jgi:hypothetical protein
LITWLYFHDLIAIMTQTAYPGQRHSGGGGVPEMMILAHFFPYLTTLRFAPLLQNSNACEIGVVSSFFPLSCAIFVDHKALLSWVRANVLATALWGLGLGLMLAWMLLPIPPSWGQVFLWHLVPPRRLLWGFGLLFVIGLGVIATRVPWRLSERRFYAFAAFVTAGWLISKIVLVEGMGVNPDLSAYKALTQGWFDLVVLLPIGCCALFLILRPKWIYRQGSAQLSILLASLVSAAATFGTFNPLQSTHAVFKLQSSPFLDAVRSLAKADQRGWTAVAGHYGAALNGLGIPVVNHVLLKPQVPFFRTAYPDMPADQLNLLFNRFAHIAVANATTPNSPQEDLVYVPLLDFGTPLPAAAGTASPVAAASGGGMDVLEAVKLDDLTWRVTVTGWIDFKGVLPEQKLTALLPGEVGTITRARGVRIPRIDVAKVLNNPDLSLSGFNLELIVKTTQPMEAFPKDRLVLWGQDQSGRVVTVPK